MENKDSSLSSEGKLMTIYKSKALDVYLNCSSDSMSSELESKERSLPSAAIKKPKSEKKKDDHDFIYSDYAKEIAALLSARTSMYNRVVVLNFTNNDIIDSIVLGQKNIEIVGYVDDIDFDATGDPRSKRCRFYKIVVNNGEGRRVQVTGWNERTAKIYEVDRLYSMVHLTYLKAESVHKMYNLGNVDFELLVQDHTEFATYGIYDDHEIQLCNIYQAMKKVGSQIRMEGYIDSQVKKCEDSSSKTGKTETYCMTSITDGTYTINLKLPADVENMELKVCQPVSVIGVVLEGNMKPATLYVKNVEDVKRIPDRKDMPAEIVNLGNKYLNRALW